MKVSDLTPPSDKALAKQVGKTLAKQYHEGGFKVPSFKEFIANQSGDTINIKHTATQPI